MKIGQLVTITNPSRKEWCYGVLSELYDNKAIFLAESYNSIDIHRLSVPMSDGVLQNGKDSIYIITLLTQNGEPVMSSKRFGSYTFKPSRHKIKPRENKKKWWKRT